ncbi:MAG: hypothetical protein HRU49_14430 [Winogradskyella sp.]|uniref:hypothetical protein n=1 Tax=Winogradskyella sp. TaxID=1883156 RepID=UPI0025D442F3|nr:hypothetical protein [Winogradskyella sp.]NRB84945.1 hypothetical protein [Winogradskyella sp.]
MKLEIKLAIYFILSVILILGGLSVMLYSTDLELKFEIPIKLGGLLLFGIGAKIFNKHFKINN